ncbi:40S ribosomal protein S17-4-like [Vigna radiata var. radiata]|uniref:40S ribosomal protein S17-4-like n=1 Tax=Vigna radiata var. radiata TaxID=3916 RepID=A0A1S3UKK8_VIGRR|nr:40S ribosomal protein S17-4-like [Vigna radiata var. radiata]
MTLGFHINKKLLEEVTIIPSERLRNKIIGFSTHPMKYIQKGVVHGISLKLQEEEHDQRMGFVSKVSTINNDHIDVDKETLEMLHSLGISDIPNIAKLDPVIFQPSFLFTRRY